jgi:hypothetical protein
MEDIISKNRIPSSVLRFPKNRRDKVEKANVSPIYWLGQALGFFYSHMNSSQTIATLSGSGWSARTSLETFTNQSQSLPLSVEAAKNIISAMDSFFTTERMQAMDVVPPHTDVYPILSAIWNFQTVLSAELPRANIYNITQKRAYDMTVLINNGEKVLSEAALYSLGDSLEDVLNDIQESAKCLAFGISTAVGFHVYRAIECIIVKDYFSVLGVDESEWERNRNMGNYIRILEEKHVDVKVTAMLKHIKDNYRNPISHPDEFWDLNKAASAFSAAISFIEIMVQDIRDLEANALLLPPEPPMLSD